jgi:hypothetical protein
MQSLYILIIKGLAMKDHHINIFHSEEDEGYIANIPEL